MFVASDDFYESVKALASEQHNVREKARNEHKERNAKFEAMKILACDWIGVNGLTTDDPLQFATEIMEGNGNSDLKHRVLAAAAGRVFVEDPEVAKLVAGIKTKKAEKTEQATERIKNLKYKRNLNDSAPNTPRGEGSRSWNSGNGRGNGRGRDGSDHRYQKSY